jgi:hypothetical protein
MTQSITPSNGAIEAPTQRFGPTAEEAPAVPMIPAQASAEPDLDAPARSRNVHGEGVRETLDDESRAEETVAHPPVGRDGDAVAEEPVTDTPHITDWRTLPRSPEPLPDLVSTLAAVPGGLGADLDDGFTFADQDWSAEDGRWDASPIGAQLAMEQAGMSFTEDTWTGARHAAE